MQKMTIRGKMGDKVILGKEVTINGTKDSNKSGPHREIDGHKIWRIVAVLVNTKMTDENMKDQTIVMVAIGIHLIQLEEFKMRGATETDLTSLSPISTQPLK
jgi:hypothetical protein